MRLSSVLHMGDQRLCEAGTGFCWNNGLFWRSSRMVVGLPCAVRGSAHMGAGPRPLPTLLFRMIPRFPPTPSAHECALSTSPGTCGCRRSLPEAAWPDSSDPSPENHPTGGLAHLKHATCPRCFDTPQPRTGSTTDLDTECDRSRHGLRPISRRNRTDLGETWREGLSVAGLLRRG